MAPLSADRVLQPGKPWPLGAHWDGNGVNFAIFSANAERIRLCLFDGERETRIDMPCCTDQVWHAYLPDAAPGLCYGYRVDGPKKPGHRFDPSHLLLDPYTRELSGQFSETGVREPLKSVVVHAPYDWRDDSPPATPLADSVLYEIHVKGATFQHPEVPLDLRGTYAGLASAPMIRHFKHLGVTAIKLLPVHAFLDEARLVSSGRTNYWGYNTLAFFAPERRYAARIGGQSVIDEFRDMVRTLHAEGIEVILDVVFNHTAETDEYGPTISFRGIDNTSYYRLPADDPDRYENFSGCGNTFNVAHPRVLQLVMDALRYWVSEMHVDGFRFDLAAALTRDSAFLPAIQQDPVLSRVKLIAEPWDLGGDGYRLGRFPPGWSEWNDRYRDDVRAFWLTGEVGIGALAQRLAGSSEIFRHQGRAPQAGVNFITAHDGFTLHDLVSYQHKHNAANGEDNRDGHNHNLSWNCGTEGETDDTTVLAIRQNLQRALLATLFVAQGVPMLQGGDEIGRTQFGNNNAYCQDSPMTWLDWQGADASLLAFSAGLIALRRALPPLRRSTWLTGQASPHRQPDIVWWHADGRPMTDRDWQAPGQTTLGFVLSDANSPRLVLVLINPAPESRTVNLPPGEWQRRCNSAGTEPFQIDTFRGAHPTAGRSVHLLIQE